jgi:thioesterase III
MEVSSETVIGPVHEYPVKILETHLDSFGHVNNAVYLQLFEEARWEIIANHGYSLDKIHETQIGPTILEIGIKFRREIRNRETIKIRTWTIKQTPKIITLRQVMINERGDEACVAEFAIGLFDMKLRKLVVSTPDWLKALGI